MKFDTLEEAEKEYERMRALARKRSDTIVRLSERINELEKALDSLHRDVTKESCCDPKEEA